MREDLFSRKLTVIYKRIEPYVFKIEFGALLFLVFAFFVKEIQPKIFEHLLLVAFNILVVLYYISSFRERPADATAVQKVVFRLAGLSQCIALIGLWFRFAKYPNADAFLLIGSLGLGAASVIMVFLRNTQKIDRDSTQVDIIRSVFILIMVLVLQYNWLPLFLK